MINGTLVIDAVVHGYNFAPDNQIVPAFVQQLAGMLYYGIHQNFSPRGQSKWILDAEAFLGKPDPDLLAHALFAESQNDIVIYHGVPVFGLLKDGGSPLWVGKAMQAKYPGRVLLYGPISPWQPNALEEVDRLVEEDGVVGLKLYPQDLVDGQMHSWRLDDPEVAFPIIERARQKGIRSIAIHKALPLGPVSIEPYLPRDVEGAAAAFPDMTFEVVHGGFAFLEETTMLAARFPNVAINLEGGSAYLVNSPKKFAELIGSFMYWGAADRLIWATGCVALHPQPFLEAFMKLEMPEDLMRDYGYPPLTDEVKQGILGGNIARILGLDTRELHNQFANDEFSKRTELAEPWSGRAANLNATMSVRNQVETIG